MLKASGMPRAHAVQARSIQCRSYLVLARQVSFPPAAIGLLLGQQKFTGPTLLAGVCNRLADRCQSSTPMYDTRLSCSGHCWRALSAPNLMSEQQAACPFAHGWNPLWLVDMLDGAS